MPSPRSAGLIAVVTVMTSLAGAASSGAVQAETGSGAPLKPVEARVVASAPVNLNELRRQAQKATNDLAAATKALLERQKALDTSQKLLSTKLEDLQIANRELAKVRQPLSNLVEYLYQAPAGSDVSGFLSGHDTDSLNAMSAVTHLVDGRNKVFADTGKLIQEQEKLAADAQELRAASLLQEAQLSAEIDTLKKRSVKLVKTLTSALQKLGVHLTKENRATGCDPTQVPVAEQYPNGLLPKAYLCPLAQSGHWLRADASIAFATLNEAYKRQFGKPMCVTSSYRTLAAQQAVYYQRPGLAAVPGRSNHGLGLAVDLCGGVQNFRSVPFNWLEANSKKYGFIHPQWAYSSPFEPWHWEYDPKIGSVL